MAKAKADFLRRHRLQRWDFKLISSEFWRVCCKLQVWPILDAFASREVYDLGQRPQSSGNQRPGFLLGSHNLVVPPGLSHSSSTGEGLTAADHGDSDLSGVDRSNVVASDR